MNVTWQLLFVSENLLWISAIYLPTSTLPEVSGSVVRLFFLTKIISWTSESYKVVILTKEQGEGGKE